MTANPLRELEAIRGAFATLRPQFHDEAWVVDSILATLDLAISHVNPDIEPAEIVAHQGLVRESVARPARDDE